MSIESLRRLFAYDAWANRRAMKAVAAAAGLGDRPRDVAAHLLAAERIWLTRLRGEDSVGLAAWPDPAPAVFEAVVDELRAGYAELLAQVAAGDLDAGVTYRNQAGKQFTMTPRDILNHVLLHSASHRGEVLAAVGQAGGDAPDTDHIAWLRVGEPSA